MSVYVVLGAGMQGTCAAYDLLRDGASEVRLGDVDGEGAQRAAARVGALAGRGSAVGVAADVADAASLRRLLEGADAVVSCVPYFLNPRVARACVEAGVGYCDLGGNTAVSAEVHGLDAAAKARGVALVPDCGLAPGLGNTLAAAILGRIPEVDDVRVYCGGLPQDPQPPFHYHLVFAMEGLLNEYDGEAEVVRDGAVVRVPTLGELEAVEVPGVGALQACTTSGGTSTCPQTWAGRLRTYEYKTLRWPGHWAKIQAYRDLGLLSEAPIDVRGVEVKPRDVLATLLRPRLTRPGARDLVALVVTGTGTRDGKPVRGTFHLVDHGDPVTGFSAMERTTAYPAAVVAQMIAGREVAPGTQRLEAGVAPEPFLAHLARRGLALSWSIET